MVTSLGRASRSWLIVPQVSGFSFQAPCLHASQGHPVFRLLLGRENEFAPAKSAKSACADYLRLAYGERNDPARCLSGQDFRPAMEKMHTIRQFPSSFS